MGNQSKIVQILIIVVGLFVALWVINSSVALPEYLQISTLVTALLIGALIISFRKLPFDYKLLSILTIGYAFGGKGFAYVSPFEPLFIGEIVLSFCLIGYVFRVFKGCPIMPTNLHWMIFIWMAVVGIYALYGFREFGKMAIRDSAIGYYGLFFFASYAMFRDGKLNQAFGKVLICCILLSYAGCALVITDLYDRVVPATAMVRRFFLPHADSFIPLVAAGTIFGLLEGISKRSILYLAVGGAGFMLLACTKTAGIFCLFCMVGFFIVFARRMDLLFTSGFVVTIVAVTVGVLVASSSPFVERVLLESDQVQTIIDVGNATGKENSSTSDWRIAWWTIVAEDTMAQNPLFGAGMGADIAGHFLESVMKIDPTSTDAQNYARYPHSIIFTVFGRMGFVGLAIFMVLLLAFLQISVSYTKRYLTGINVDRNGLLALCIFLAGVVNAMVQATYEVPHGAIINWICLGFITAHYQQGIEAERVAHRRSLPNSGTSQIGNALNSPS